MRFLSDEVLRPLLLPDGKSRHARARSRDGMQFGAITEGIPEVQDVGGAKVLIQT